MLSGKHLRTLVEFYWLFKTRKSNLPRSITDMPGNSLKMFFDYYGPGILQIAENFKREVSLGVHVEEAKSKMVES